MTNQSIDTTQVQLGELMSFIGVTYKNIDEGSLTVVERLQDS